jgi:hypothetical protein
MPTSSRFMRIAAVCLLAGIAPAAENAAPAPNSDPTYQQLRNIGLSGEAVSVKDFILKRDAATFHLQSGTVCFVTPVQGKITGAVFIGQGNMVLEPPVIAERKSLRLLSRQEEFVEEYSRLVLRFTDGTYDEIKKAGSKASAGCDPNLLNDSLQALRHDRELRFNLEGRILQDVLGTAPGGLFVAFVHGTRYSDKEIYAVDPHGAPPFLSPPVDPRNIPTLTLPPVAPEEVELLTYDETKVGMWAAFHLQEEYKTRIATGTQNNLVAHIERQQLDTTIEKNATLIGKATTTFVSQIDGLRVVPFSLFNRLRVNSVTADGAPLSFIQEGKDDDAQFFSVILPKPLSIGEKFTIVTSYEGRDAVTNEGNGNYYPVARDDWYPNSAGAGLGQYTSYDLTFRIPKGMKIAATGTLVSETVEGEHSVSVWKSEVPQTVAGFNFGKFKVQEAHLTKPEYTVLAYANENPPDWVASLRHAAEGNEFTEQRSRFGIPERPEVALGNMGTTALGKKALADGELSIELYTDYFGPLSFKRLAMTQQTACNYGQSWPQLVWLPLCSFFDTTVRNQLGLAFADRGYWKTVAPHEVAHQWWGHAVGFNSYRDQWMSEGFADMSASLFIQMVERDPKKFIEFWNDERWLLTQKDNQGFRAIDAGPMTQGYRLDNSRTGYNVTRMLIYPKGAYVLHMVRMMMWDRQTGDQNFKATMQDFVKTYSGRSATTEDFKTIVEKHQTPEMAAIGGGKMDWFFDEYVYGTALPSYKFEPSFDKDANGDVVMSFKLTQSNVDQNFRMLVPIYLEMADGRVLPLGRARLIGNTSIEQKVPLKGIKDRPTNATINYFDDVLASAN